MMDASVTDIARIIQLAVAPVFLLTAIGTILSALNNRLGRIVDRRRVLLDRLRMRPGEEAARVKADVEELSLLAQRIRLIYHAIMLAVVCALFVCLLVAGAFLGVFITADLAKLVGTLFILAMFALIGSLGMFLREIFLAVKGGRHQLTLHDVIK
jgi:energy-converting hydrogenase Eha subunit C